MKKRKTAVLTVLLLLFAVLGLLSGIRKVESATTTIYVASGSDDGRVYGYDLSYSTARSNGYSSESTAITALNGQYHAPSSGYYLVERVFLKFNTTIIPTSAYITSAAIELCGYDDHSTTDFTINLQKWTGDTPIELADYTQYDGVTYDNEGFSTSSFSTSGYNAITISNFDVITKAGYTKICVRSSRDVSGIAPEGDEFVYYCLFEKGSGYIPRLTITYSNYPVNDSLELTNPSIASQGCLAQKQTYIFRVKVTDDDGGTNINQVRLYLRFSAMPNHRFYWTESTDTFGEATGYDPSDYFEITSTSADSSLSGNQWTLDFKIIFHWNYPTESLESPRLQVQDDSGLTDTDDYSNLYYVENDLISSGRTVNDYRVNPSQSLTFSGTLYYEGTTTTPPDGDYAITIKLGGVIKATDSTLVSGAFSTSANAESTVGSYTYNVDFTYETGADTFTAVIVDKIVVTISANSTNPTSTEKTELTTTATYQYDSTSVTTLSFQMTRNGSNFSTSSPVVDGAYTDTVYVYTISSASETTYGLNQFGTNTVTVTWGANIFIEIYDITTPDLRLDVNAQAYTYYRGRFSNNQSAVSSGTLYYKLNATGTQYSASFNSTGWACVNGSRSSVGRIYLSVDAVNVNGETDVSVITETHWIVWDRLEIVSVSASNTHVNMSGTFELRYTIRYDYDDVPFSSSKGSISGFSFDEVNGWWEKIVTASSSATSTNYNQTYITISDDAYGLTVKTSASVNVITDGLKVSQSLDLDSKILYLCLKYAYNDSVISSGSVYFAGSIQVTNSSGWANYTLSSLSDFSWGQIAYGISDAVYNITYNAENQTIPLEKLGEFILNTQVSHTIASTQWQSGILSFSVSGTGSATINVYFSGSLIPYYVKINGMAKVEGDSWIKSSGLVTITDTLSSIHTYTISFQPLGGTTTGGSTQSTSEAIDESVQTVKEIIYRLSSNWISVILLLALLLPTVISYAFLDNIYVTTFLLAIFVTLAVNFLLAFIVIPQGLLPKDLAILERFTFKPPALELSTLPIATQSIIQIVVMSFLLCSVMGSVVMLIIQGED